MKNSFIINLIDSEPVAVVGLGVSNLPLVDFLLDRGASVTVYDKKGRDELGGDAKRLEQRGARLILGENYLDVHEKVIFRTPGIRQDAINAPDGAYITSEMELFFELSPTKICAITGSDGKTTTTTLSHLFYEAQKARDGRGRAYVGGNIGAPLLPLVDKMTSDDVAVLELSSFQLMGMRHAPDVAAITNVTPNHLNWHVDMAEYTEAKKSICGTRTKKIILNADNAVTSSFRPQNTLPVYFSSTKTQNDFAQKNAHLVYEKNGSIIYFDGIRETETLRVSDIKLPGKHNLENYMTAIALTFGDVDCDVYAEVAKSFGGVEHRLELVATKGGVKYYNSSIDSSPTRTAAALSALYDKPIVICGGSEKGISYEPLAEILCARAKAVILNGASASSIARALNSCPAFSASKIAVYTEKDLESAFCRAVAIAGEGDSILLSPASASFDQFKNFAERGKAFKALVWSLDEKN